jgi:hypothetical protein
MGDRWVNGSIASRYVWLPLKFTGTAVHMDWYDEWDMNAAAGTWSPVINGQNLAIKAVATASSQWDTNYTAAKANDGNAATRWNSANGTANGEWLQLDFGASVTFNKIILHEYENRITIIKLQQWNGSAWADIYSGTTIGSSRIIFLPSVISSKVRLLIVASTSTPTIAEFEVYNYGATALKAPVNPIHSHGKSDGNTILVVADGMRARLPQTISGDGNFISIYSFAGQRLNRAIVRDGTVRLNENGGTRRGIYLVHFYHTDNNVKQSVP